MRTGHLLFLCLFAFQNLTCKGQISHIADILPSPGGKNNPYVSEACVMNGMIYFISGGNALWVSDGTSTGTHIMKQFPDYTFDNGSYSYSANNLFNLENRILLFFTNGDSGVALWRSDGTESGTFKIRYINDLHYLGGHSDPLVVSGNLFFTSFKSSGRSQLWKSDGTVEGTQQIKIINIQNPYYSNRDFYGPPNLFANCGGRLFFWASDSIHGFEPWISDGTDSGTHMLKDINRLPYQGSMLKNQAVTSEVAIKPYFYFAASDSSGSGIWQTDGSDTGTHLMAKFLNPQKLLNVGGKLVFEADSGYITRFCISDGSRSGTHFLAAPKLTGNQYFYMVRPNFILGNTLYFTGDETSAGQELWRLDNDQYNPVMVKDIWPGMGSSFNAYPFYIYSPSDSFAGMNGKIFFSADDGIHGNEFWQSDGTLFGTFMIADLLPGIRSSKCRLFKTIGNALYFFAVNDTGLNQLWKYLPESGIDQEHQAGGIQVYTYGKQLYIKNHGTRQGAVTLDLYDLNGRRLIERKLPYSYSQHIDLPEIPDGIYICVTQSAAGIFSDKLLIREY